MAEFSHPVRIAEVPEEGRYVRLEASPPQCQHLAPGLGLLALHRLSAELDLQPLRGGGLAVRGALKAVVEQSCVVTLEPIKSDVDRAIDLAFLPPAAFQQHEAGLKDGIGDLENGPDVEPLEGDCLDLGEIVLQELSLALDPYPRKEGADFAGFADEDEAAHAGRKGPFADLGRLIDEAS